MKHELREYKKYNETQLEVFGEYVNNILETLKYFKLSLDDVEIKMASEHHISIKDDNKLIKLPIL